MKFVYIKEAGGIKIPIPCSYMDCIDLVKSDWYRYSGIIPSFPRILWGLRNIHTGFSFWLRCSSYHGIFHRFCNWKLKRYQRKYGLIIDPETKIGYGLNLGHCLSVVINPTAVIGNNVNLSQFVTIGSNERKAAVVGDNVYIGPNSCIVEDVIIGRDSVIGAGAVVVKDVDEGVTVGGCPAKVISNHNSARFIVNKWCE